jgi:hypothetical protein
MKKHYVSNLTNDILLILLTSLVLKLGGLFILMEENDMNFLENGYFKQKRFYIRGTFPFIKISPLAVSPSSFS